MLQDGNCRYARLKNAGLLGSDLRERIAKDGHVIIADRADNREQRRDHVCAVVAPTQANFKNCEIDRVIGEVAQRNREAKLEDRRLAVLPAVEVRERGGQRLNDLDELGLTDRLAADLDALAIRMQMRRG